jgi:mono/diheme cytochrome c family protein
MNVRRALSLKLSIGGIAIVAALCLPAFGGDTPAASGDSASKPVSFSAGQARQGSLLYRDNCASCHGDRLNGALDAPPLSGDKFLSKWAGKPVAELFDFVSTNMPQDRPGALTAKQYTELVALILSKNGTTAGDTELPSDPASMATMVLPGATP